MSKKVTSIQDIAESISDLATMVGRRFDQVDERFDRLEERMDRMEVRMDSIEAEVRAMRVDISNLKIWLEQVDGRLTAVENDTREIYLMLSRLEKDLSKKVQKDDYKALESRFDEMLQWAKKVSISTGVPLPKF